MNMNTIEGSQTKFPVTLVALALLALLAVLLSSVIDTPAGKILTTDHATKHVEAVEIRTNLCQRGPDQIRLHNEDPGIIIFCVDINKNKSNCPPRWGIMIAQVWHSVVLGTEYRERTSFCPSNGEPGKVRQYLDRFSTSID